MKPRTLKQKIDVVPLGRLRPRFVPELTGYVLLSLALVFTAGCTSDPPMTPSTRALPTILAPVSMIDVRDARVRFREIFCKIMEQHGEELPDYRPCAEALVRLANEAPASGKPVDLGPSKSPFQVLFVPGLGWTCFEQIITTADSVARHLARLGHEVTLLNVGALSSSEENARLIRNAIVAMPAPEGRKRAILIGYSKGAVDVLEAITGYPELQTRVAAVVSLAGSIGGSQLAYDVSQSSLNLLQYLPGARCELGDAGALDSLKPSVRQAWLAANPLPKSVRFYSLVTYPAPTQISKVLRPSYDKLSQIEVHNDSQLIFSDQVVPGSVLLGYLNADHWAVAVPINRSHPVIASIFVDKNAFPREVLMEAVLRFIEEDI